MMEEMIGDVMYAWQEQTPDGRWGTIAGAVPSLGLKMAPLVSRDLKPMLQLFESIARARRVSSGHPVRLARFDYASTLTDLE